MSDIASLELQLSNLKDTDSTKVEYNTAGESLQGLLEIVKEILATRGVPYVEDLTELQALAGSEARMAYLADTGFFIYEETEDNGYASTDGIGYWNLKQPLVLTELVSGTPANGMVPVWNAGQGRAVWANPTVAALNWLNITNTPTTIAGYGIVDKLLLLDAQNNLRVNGSNLPALGVGAANNIDVATQAIPNLTLGSGNVLLSVLASLAATDPALSLVGALIAGNPGLLTAFVASGALTNIIALGTNGVLSFAKDQHGRHHIGTPSGDLSVLTAILNIWGALKVNGNIAATGDAAVTGGATIGGNTAIGASVSVNATTGAVNANSLVLANSLSVGGDAGFNGRLELPVWDNAGRPPFPNPGTAGFNSDADKLEYANNAGAWVQLP